MFVQTEMLWTAIETITIFATAYLWLYVVTNVKIEDIQHEEEN